MTAGRTWEPGIPPDCDDGRISARIAGALRQGCRAGMRLRAWILTWAVNEGKQKQEGRSGGLGQAGQCARRQRVMKASSWV
ncbi:hypothetical protein FH972_021679 [Carpinus fangiana]|uniref:Uncharacterized protein n=1 Tax=Carpinus fangiana TaxID=176857 RepID=A0A5N6KQN4_9ROSI|nr:hypothetical protein FH972_021679 [Carpinus fangiana]